MITHSNTSKIPRRRLSGRDCSGLRLRPHRARAKERAAHSLTRSPDVPMNPSSKARPATGKSIHRHHEKRTDALKQSRIRPPVTEFDKALTETVNKSLTNEEKNGKAFRAVAASFLRMTAVTGLSKSGVPLYTPISSPNETVKGDDRSQELANRDGAIFLRLLQHDQRNLQIPASKHLQLSSDFNERRSAEPSKLEASLRDFFEFKSNIAPDSQIGLVYRLREPAYQTDCIAKLNEITMPLTMALMDSKDYELMPQVTSNRINIDLNHARSVRISQEHTVKPVITSGVAEGTFSDDYEITVRTIFDIADDGRVTARAEVLHAELSESARRQNASKELLRSLKTMGYNAIQPSLWQRFSNRLRDFFAKLRHP